MPGKDPLESLTDKAQITVRLPYELSFLAQIPKFPLALRALARKFYEPHASFIRNNPEHNEAVFNSLCEISRELIESEILIDQTKKEAARKAAVGRIIKNEESET